MATRAISRRTASKLEIVTASGVSSTTTSTPAADSKARMLRPFLPMIRPFISSLGRGTTETVTSDTWSLATRWMASEISSRALSSADSFASSSISRMIRAMSWRASPSVTSSNFCLASSVVMAATRSSSSIRSCSSISSLRPRLSILLWRLFSRCSRISIRFIC